MSGRVRVRVCVCERACSTTEVYLSGTEETGVRLAPGPRVCMCVRVCVWSLTPHPPPSSLSLSLSAATAAVRAAAAT